MRFSQVFACIPCTQSTRAVLLPVRVYCWGLADARWPIRFGIAGKLISEENGPVQTGVEENWDVGLVTLWRVVSVNVFI